MNYGPMFDLLQRLTALDARSTNRATGDLDGTGLCADRTHAASRRQGSHRTG